MRTRSSCASPRPRSITGRPWLAVRCSEPSLRRWRVAICAPVDVTSRTRLTRCRHPGEERPVRHGEEGDLECDPDRLRDRRDRPAHGGRGGIVDREPIRTTLVAGRTSGKRGRESAAAILASRPTMKSDEGCERSTPWKSRRQDRDRHQRGSRECRNRTRPVVGQLVRDVEELELTDGVV